MNISELVLKEYWKYLEFEIRYSVPVEKYLKAQLNFKKEGAADFDAKFLSQLKKAEKEGLKEIERVKSDIADNVDKVSNLYKYRKEYFIDNSKNLDELDFCDREITICDSAIFFLVPIIEKHFGPFNEEINRRYNDITLMIKIFKAYRLQVQGIINLNLDNTNRYDHITKLRYSNRIIGFTEFGSINENIQRFIKEEFRYFEEKHQSDFYKTLRNIYYHDCDSIYLIAQTTKDKIKLASIKLSMLRKEIKSSLNDFERFLVYLKNKYPEDCVRLVQILKAIQVQYRAILSGHGVEIENTYNYEILKNQFKEWELEYLKNVVIADAPSISREQKAKRTPSTIDRLITFKNTETIEKIHFELKGYFSNKEAELLKALQGEQLSEILLFPHNQNKFVEVFRRLKYNGFLLNTDTETKNWICTTFQFVKKGFAEPQPFNESSVWDNLNKGKGEPTRKERICITEWLPHKSPLQLTRETENEKL
jgi:hypothetical protein